MTIIHACICYIKTKDALGWSKAEALALKKRFAELKGAGGKSSTSASHLSKTASSRTASATDFNKKHLQQLQQQAANAHNMIVRPFDRLLGQSLELLESCMLLYSSSSSSVTPSSSSSSSSSTDIIAHPTTQQLDQYASMAHTVSTELLGLICPPLVLYKVKSLLLTSLTLTNPQQHQQQQHVASLYNACRDESLLSLVSSTFLHELPGARVLAVAFAFALTVGVVEQPELAQSSELATTCTTPRRCSACSSCESRWCGSSALIT